MTHDLHEMYWDKFGKKRFHRSTIKQNLPYAVVKTLKKDKEKENYPKGTYFVITKNGEKPIINDSTI